MSFKGLLGLAAIGGAVAYARKHGGFQNAVNHLMARKDELVGKAKTAMQNQGIGAEGSSVSGSSAYGGSSYGTQGRSSVLDEEPVTYSGGYTPGSNGLNRR